MAHQHPCAHCQVQTDCDGEIVENVDGWPETYCLAFHEPYGTSLDFQCADCHEAQQRGQCDDCGAYAGERHLKGCALYTSPLEAA